MPGNHHSSAFQKRWIQVFICVFTLTISAMHSEVLRGAAQLLNVMFEFSLTRARQTGIPQFLTDEQGQHSPLQTHSTQYSLQFCTKAWFGLDRPLSTMKQETFRLLEMSEPFHVLYVFSKTITYIVKNQLTHPPTHF